MNPADATCRDLGIVIEETGPGRAVARLRISEEMANGYGIAHGGYLFLLADTAFSYACNSRGPALAQEGQIHFLRPVPVGAELIAEAVERVRSGRVGICDVTVRRGDGTVVAEFRGQSQSVSESFLQSLGGKSE